MRIVDATFVNNEFEPGWLILKEDLPLGRRYRVDLDRIEEATIVNRLTGQRIVTPCIYVLQPEPAGWLPMAALKIEADYD